MTDGPDPISPGSTGTVTAVRQHGTWSQVDVDWDNGRKLMLVGAGEAAGDRQFTVEREPPEVVFVKLTRQPHQGVISG